MTTQSMSYQVQLTLPGPLYQWLAQTAQQQAQDIAAVIQTALEYYQQHFDIRQTQTWKLCGAFTVAEAEARYLQNNNATTHYAADVDTRLDCVLAKFSV